MEKYSFHDGIINLDYVPEWAEEAYEEAKEADENYPIMILDEYGGCNCTTIGDAIISLEDFRDGDLVMVIWFYMSDDDYDDIDYIESGSGQVIIGHGEEIADHIKNSIIDID